MSNRFVFKKDIYSDPYPGLVQKPEYNYKSDIDEFGNMIVVVDSERDIQAEINSYSAECNIYTILARHEAGDPTALTQKSGVYLTEEMVKSAQDFVAGKSLDSQLFESYQKFGSDKCTFDKFTELIKAGKYDELLAMKKEEVNKNGE